jgi:hypothetical protein
MWNNFDDDEDRLLDYFRIMLHESGHCFNLEHPDYNGQGSVMGQTYEIDGLDWHYHFSEISQEHLKDHCICAVAPGGEAYGLRSCQPLHVTQH